MFIIYPGRILLLCASLSALFFYGAAHTEPGGFRRLTLALGALAALFALSALRWVWRGFVGFFR